MRTTPPPWGKKGLVRSIERFVLCLCGTEFVLLTNHKSLLYRNKAKFLNDRIMRWTTFLKNYRFMTEWIKGKDNARVDYLSRVVYTRNLDIRWPLGP